MQTSWKPVLAAVLICSGLAAVGRAETVEQFDLRRQPDDGKGYYVVLCARKSEPWGTGHTFVVLVEQDQWTGQVKSTGFGFYPGAERVVLALFTGQGAVADESTRAASVKPQLLTHRLIFRVDREAFAAALAVRERWKSEGYDYHLVRRNCMHFGQHVCRAIGLNVPGPAFGERPTQYVARLMAYDWEPSTTVRAQQPSTFISIRDR